MKNNIGKHIGARLRALREERGLTQAQLASLCRKSVETVSNFERGKTLPSILTLVDLADRLDVPLQQFFDIATTKAKKPQPDFVKAMSAKASTLSSDEKDLVLDFANMISRICFRSAGRSQSVRRSVRSVLVGYADV